jgi:hypothetical protein
MKPTARIEPHATIDQMSTVNSRLYDYGLEHRSIMANESERLPVALPARVGFETQPGP